MTKGYNFKTQVHTRFADFDLFGHVNNAVYLTYFEMARSAFWNEIIRWDWEAMGIIIAQADIRFLKPIRLNDQVHAYVKTARVGTTSFVLEYILTKGVGDDEEICTTGSTVCVTFDYDKNEKAPIPPAQLSRMIEFDALV
jgi:acyl-CoA thioester hydrolase